ncbi:hypothetical protein ONS96_014935 [Cadophora gregata f. sp. sojae]|nr:hypothetical protein ONS96_014935 [Cadophora gregata f. sp. sojae]
MSSSPPEPENAAPSGTVRPESVPKISQDGDHNKNVRRPWTQPPRTKSASLLTQALATSYEADEHPTNSFTDSPDTYQPELDFPQQNDSRRNEVNNAQDERFPTQFAESSRSMPAAGMRTAGSPGSTSTSTFTHFNLHDMRHVNSLLMSHRDFLGSSKGRGTSLERTEKEKRVEDLPKGTYSTNAGDTGLTRPSTPTAPASVEPITTNPPTDGLRAQYRSWRDARPTTAAEKAWSIGEHGSHDSDGGQVEKSIAEALAGVEPNNRSRKASHSLRFFREGLPEDKAVKKDVKNRGRSKDGLSRGKSYSDQPRLKSGPQSPREDGAYSAASPGLDRASLLQSGLETRTSKRDDYLPLNPTEGLAAEAGYFDSSHTIETVSEEQLKELPAQLLADIRKHHNLTPGATKGSSFSQSIPVTASERPQSITTKSEVAGEGTIVKEIVEDSEEACDGAELSHIKSADEDDDSGEEQISSALFVPHKTPHDSPERERGEKHSDVELDQEHEQDNSNSQWLEEHAVPSRDVDEKYLSHETNSRPLASPSDIKPSKSRSEADVTAAAVTEPADTDRDSQDDGGYTTLGEDSVILDDDPDTTPTGSLKPIAPVPPTTTQPLHDHQQKPKQPLETIELIPYRHQVGGHTTMWRFSKRAVCKQLNNSENKFYETVEQYHPALLKFLPRYAHFRSRLDP